MSDPINWTCPFCNRPQTIVESQCATVHPHFKLAKHKFGVIGLHAKATACSNPDCQEVSVEAWTSIGKIVEGRYGDTYRPDKYIEQFQLRPRSTSVPQPDYIPLPLRQDYLEACEIRTLSPKASATLARRCIQGMIRDFCKISKPRLIDEIRALKKSYEEGQAPKGVELETIDAIDHVRSIGNIGAHMEADINAIVDVDPGEAQALIGLIELLFDEWYVARQKRQERLEKIKTINSEKEEVKAAHKAKQKSEPQC